MDTSVAPTKALTTSSASSEFAGQPEACQPDGWRQAVAGLVAAAERSLWLPEGTRALRYVRGLGLNDQTIVAGRLGYWLQDSSADNIVSDRPVQVPRGIVVPWREGDSVQAVRIRRPVNPPASGGVKSGHDSGPMFVLIPGSRKEVYPSRDVIQIGQPLVLVEDEFDALLLGQELRGLASVIVVGADGRPKRRDLSAMLGAPRWIMAQSDCEPIPGWLSTTDRFSRVQPPVPTGMDWTQLRRAGMDLRAWWLSVLEGRSPPRSSSGGFGAQLSAPRPSLSAKTPIDRASGYGDASEGDSSLAKPIISGAADERDPTNSTNRTLDVDEPGASGKGALSAYHGLDRVRERLTASRFREYEGSSSPSHSRATHARRDIIPEPSGPDDATMNNGRWLCTNRLCLHKTGWWMSAHGVVNCRNCRPPARPDLVVASGSAGDAPKVQPDRSNQAVEGPASQDQMAGNKPSAPYPADDTSRENAPFSSHVVGDGENRHPEDPKAQAADVAEEEDVE